MYIYNISYMCFIKKKKSVIKWAGILYKESRMQCIGTTLTPSLRANAHFVTHFCTHHCSKHSHLCLTGQRTETKNKQK